MLTLGGSNILTASILLPHVGIWTADLEVDTETAPTGTVTLSSDAGPSWRGTVIDGAVSLGTWRGRLVGGAGGLRRELTPLAYRGATLADVLADALREAGETRAAASGDLSPFQATRYMRIEQLGARTVADVAAAAGWSWRVLADGSVWVGAEAWDPIALEEVDVIGHDPRERRYELAGETLGIYPGATVLLRTAEGDTGVQVDTVLHRLEGAHLTTTVWEANG